MNDKNAKPKSKWGDRWDGVWLKDVSPIHQIMPYIYPNRADNEAFISETIDLAPIDEYIQKKNAELKEGEEQYKFFQVLLSAIIKTVALRPKMNRFIQGRRMYQRKFISVAFVVKKKFKDNGAEALLTKRFDEKTTIEDVHRVISNEINELRKDDNVDNSTEKMDMFSKIPRWILRPAFCIIRKLDFFGKVPYSLVKDDPNYSTCFITNLGSIGLKSGYHHLTNWGTNSLFAIVGEKKLAPNYDANGNVTMREVVPIGLTVDERIADGYYYAKTVKLLKKLLENPELLEKEAGEPVEY